MPIPVKNMQRKGANSKAMKQPKSLKKKKVDALNDSIENFYVIRGGEDIS